MRTMPAADSVPPAPSALSNLIATSGTGIPQQQQQQHSPARAIALQVLHNLQHQHFWTDLVFHDVADTSSKQQQQQQHAPLPPPPPLILSGIPPQKVYIHPDEQISLLEQGVTPVPDREYVLPTCQGEKWTLRRLSAVMDLLPLPLPQPENQRQPASPSPSSSPQSKTREEVSPSANASVSQTTRNDDGGHQNHPAKRNDNHLLLAMVNTGMGGDGTVAYYVVLDGHVKPRQN